MSLKDLTLEDLAIGQVFESGSVMVTAEDIMRFAGEFDPQPFHTDPEAAKGLFFGGLVASGWHTAALTMRLLVSSLPLAGGLIGAGIDELRWPRPTYPGDILRVRSEVIELRPSKGRPDRGMGKARCTTFNQRGEDVQILVPNLVLMRRV